MTVPLTGRRTTPSGPTTRVPDPGPTGPPPRRHRLRTALLVLAVLAAGAALVWLVAFSPVLAVRDVRVVPGAGAPPLTPAVAAAAVRVAAVPIGRPLARVDADAVRARVLALPRVADVEVRRGWPHEVVLAVTERVPVAVTPMTGAPGTWTLVDASGATFDLVAAQPPGLPEVTAPATALPTAVAVVAGLPDRLRPLVTSVTATTVDDVTLTLNNGSTVRWGSAEDGELKARVLVALLPRRAVRYDVSAPLVPTTSRERGPRATPGPSPS